MAVECKAQDPFIKTLQRGYKDAGIRGLGGVWVSHETPRSQPLSADTLTSKPQLWETVVTSARGLGSRF